MVIEWLLVISIFFEVVGDLNFINFFLIEVVIFLLFRVLGKFEWWINIEINVFWEICLLSLCFIVVSVFVIKGVEKFVLFLFIIVFDELSVSMFGIVVCDEKLL